MSKAKQNAPRAIVERRVNTHRGTPRKRNYFAVITNAKDGVLNGEFPGTRQECADRVNTAIQFHGGSGYVLSR